MTVTVRAPWAALLATTLALGAPGFTWAQDSKSKPPLWLEGRASQHAALPSVPALLARSRPGVVQVRGRLGSTAGRAAGGQLSVGTGFVISTTGHIITNEHVVRDAEDLQVRLSDGREIPACVVGLDAATDIALLKANVAFPLTPLLLGDPSIVRAGDDVFVIGSPFGFDHSVSAGIVSAKDRIVDRSVSSAGTVAIPYAFYLQTDAAINMGNSGGPLLSRHGLVIGVASAYWGGSHPAHGIGFAIPIDVVKRLLPQLAAHGHVRRSRLGLDVQTVDPFLAEAFGLQNTRGALLADVEVDGPGSKIGLRPGDVVVEWGTHEVAGVEDFKIYAQLTPPGERVAVKLFRGKRVMRVMLETVAAANPNPTPHTAACRGASPVKLPLLGLELGAPGAKGGIVVRKVTSGAAREAGLLPGDIITQVQSTPVVRAADVRAALMPFNHTHALLIRREQSTFWVALPPHQGL